MGREEIIKDHQEDEDISPIPLKFDFDSLNLLFPLNLRGAGNLRLFRMNPPGSEQDFEGFVQYLFFHVCFFASLSFTFKNFIFKYFHKFFL